MIRLREAAACVRHRASRSIGIALLALALPAVANAECRFRALRIPVRIEGARAQTTVRIEGKDVPLMVDSGAFYSFLSEPAARQLGLQLRHAPEGLRVWGINGVVDIRMTTVKKLQIDRGELSNIEFLVGGNDTGHGNAGLLGRNILAASDVEFDLANGDIRVMFPSDGCADERNLAYWTWGNDTPVTELPMRGSQDRFPAIEADVVVNGTKVRALFDTGADTVLSRHAARDVGIKAEDMAPGRIMLGAGAGEARSWNARVATIEFGGEKIANSRLDIGDFSEPEMLVGMDFFLSHRIYVSLKQRKMFVTYNGGQVFARNTVAPPAGAAAPADSGPLPDAAAYLRRATARAGRHEYAAALADLDQACALAPEVADNFRHRARVHAAMGQPGKALADFDTAVRIAPQDGETRLARAQFNAQEAHPDAALADLRAMGQWIPTQSDLPRGMAHLYMTLDLPADAIERLDQWLSTHPRDAARAYALNERCWARLRLGAGLDQALDDCNEAADMAPDNASLIDSRAWVHLRRGEWRDARRDFDRSLKLKPDAAWSLYGRGLLRTRTGDAEGGRADLEAARRLEPDLDDKVRHSGVAGDLTPAAPMAAAAASQPAR